MNKIKDDVDGGCMRDNICQEVGDGPSTLFWREL